MFLDLTLSTKSNLQILLIFLSIFLDSILFLSIDKRKTLFDAKTGEILGAHMIGPEVTELINTFSLAMKLEATEADIMSTVFPHPTLSEAIHESTLDAYNEAIHI